LHVGAVPAAASSPQAPPGDTPAPPPDQPAGAQAAAPQEASLELAGGQVAPPPPPTMTPAIDEPAGVLITAAPAPPPTPSPDSPATEAAALRVDAPEPITPPQPEPDATAERRPTPESGADLRDERQRLRLAIETIAEKTKIRRAYLQAIEEERFGDLPAAVFVRGFLREYARCLGLPGEDVARNYMKRYRDWQESKGQPSGPASPFSHN